MPTYNRAYCIHKAIDSIAGQTNPNWELIVVDDGSTDNTEEIIKSVNDDRIYYRQDNKGPGAARNTGLRYAKRV